MRRVVGNAYANSKEDMKKIIAALQNDTFTIAYNNVDETSIVVMETELEEDKEEE